MIIYKKGKAKIMIFQFYYTFIGTVQCSPAQVFSNFRVQTRVCSSVTSACRQMYTAQPSVCEGRVEVSFFGHKGFLLKYEMAFSVTRGLFC
jgi:hypothetical protein